MLSQPALAQALVAVRPQAVAFADLTFRSVHLRHFANYAVARPLLATPGGVAGSRYVMPNGPPALYVSLDAGTAYREGNQAFFQTSAAPAGATLRRTGGLRPDPVVTLGIFVRTTLLLDLRDIATRQQLGIQAEAELLGPWRSVHQAPTQVLGDAVFHDGQFEGIVFPSAQNTGHHCLVIFPARLQHASQVDFKDSTTQLADHLP